jgi:RNA polymerase sigma-70 factor (ECF subfamily)
VTTLDGPSDRVDRPFDLAAEYDLHGPALFGYAVNALRDRQLAEDCVQETFLRAWRSRDRFDPERAGMRTWLFAIQRNVIVDTQRSMQRMPRIHPPEVLDEAAAEHPDPLEHLGMIEALASLSEEHRAAVIAVHLSGETYAEVSAASGVPVSTLRTRVFYALRALRAHFEGGHPAPAPHVDHHPRKDGRND